MQDAKCASIARFRSAKSIRLPYYCQKHHDGCSNFLSKIVFTDECMFHLNGHVYAKNVRIWGTERPFEGTQVPTLSSEAIPCCVITK